MSQAKGYRATQAFELGEGVLSKSDRKRPKPSRNQTSIGCLTYVGAYPGYTTGTFSKEVFSQGAVK